MNNFSKIIKFIFSARTCAAMTVVRLLSEVLNLFHIVLERVSAIVAELLLSRFLFIFFKEGERRRGEEESDRWNKPV